MEELTGGWRKLYDKLHNLWSSPNIIRVIKSTMMRWAGHVERMGKMRSAFEILVGKPKEKTPLVRPMSMRGDNIKMIFGKLGLGFFYWIHLAQGLMVGSCEHSSKPWCSMKCGEFLN
jgi:hypothetical protein